MPSFNFYLYDLLYHFSIVKPPLVEIKVILFLFYQGTWVPVVTGTVQLLAPFSYVIFIWTKKYFITHVWCVRQLCLGTTADVGICGMSPGNGQDIFVEKAPTNLISCPWNNPKFIDSS